MGIGEFLLRVMATLEPMIISIIAIIVLTCAVLPVLIASSKGLWVTSPSFKFMGIFLNMKLYDCVRLASAWIKLILIIVFVLQFKKLEAIHYISFAIVSLIYAVDFKRLISIPENIFWFVIQIIAMFSVNLICGYIIDVTAKIQFILLYVVLAIFAILFAIYMFISEINQVSLGRRTSIEKKI